MGNHRKGDTPPSVVLHGLKSCDTCRKAMRFLKEREIDVRLRDLRQEPVSEEEIRRWLDAAGAERLINRRGTTWRGLSEQERARAEEDPAGLLSAHPALAKRPVIVAGDTLLVGFGPDEQEALLAALGA